MTDKRIIMIQTGEFYIDLDGVLFDFEHRYTQVTGQLLPAQLTTEQKESVFGYEFFRYINPNFELYERVLEQFKTIPRVLSSVGKYKSEEIIQAKRDALAEHFPELTKNNPIFVKTSSDKIIYARGATIIDDREKVLKPWLEAGGIALQYDIKKDVLQRYENI